MRRTRQEIARPIREYRSPGLYLDYSKLHKDILIKLNELKKPQAYLVERLIISRATLQRISKGKTIELKILLRLVDWLDQEITEYIKRK